MTQNRSRSPFILFSGYPRHWRLISKWRLIFRTRSARNHCKARDEEMDVDVKEEANEEVTFTERVEECLKEVGDANIDVDSVVDAGVSMLSYCTT